MIVDLYGNEVVRSKLRVVNDLVLGVIVEGYRLNGRDLLLYGIAETCYGIDEYEIVVDVPERYHLYTKHLEHTAKGAGGENGSRVKVRLGLGGARNVRHLREVLRSSLKV